MAFNIGPVRVQTPVFLAPMSGVSDLPFRRAVARFGVGMVFSEMIASRPMLEEARRGTLRAADYTGEFPMAVQLAGCEPDVMAETAKFNAGRGAAIIDINFGCPVKKVVKNFAGSAIMRDEALACQIMRAVARAVDVPVTVKMRLGWDHDCINAPTIARMAQDEGLKMVTVHGRTRNQLYNGVADWHAVRAVRDAVTLPLVVNGDIDGPEAARAAMAASGADGVMIGRAACGRPWLPRQVMDAMDGTPATPTPDAEALLPVIVQHYDEIIAHYGQHVGIGIARKHVGWYLEPFANSDETRARINRMDDPASVKAAMTAFLATPNLEAA